MKPKSLAFQSAALLCRVAVLAGLGATATAPPASAQEPPPADTAAVVPDTVGIEPDTAAVVDVPPDPAPPPDTLPPPEAIRMPDPGPAGWASGVWIWEREDLLASGALSLTELLDRVPGIVPVRTGIRGLPEAVAAFGLGAGRVEVVLDGFVLDPFTDASLDLSRIELMHLKRVRVERRTDLLRIALETLAPWDSRPYSLVEAGTGDFRTNLFRGLFLAPRVLGGPLGLAVERLETDGAVGREPAHTFAGWARWGLGDDRRSVHAELRRASIERGEATPVPGEGMRTDWVVRARARPVTGLIAEAYFGRSSVEDEFELADPGAVDANGGFGTLDPDGEDGGFELDGESPTSGGQGGVRAHLEAGPAWFRAGFRHRTHRAGPASEVEAIAGASLGEWVAVTGEATWADWRGSGTARAWSARVRTRPVLGASVFGEWSEGRRGTVFPITAEGAGDEGNVFLVDRTGWRAGGELALGRLHAAAAVVGLEADSTAAFGLAFDPVPRFYRAGRARGWEVAGRVPLFWDFLEVQGSWTSWWETGQWIYLPASLARAALVYHHLPLGSDQLEILARLEGSRRGAMRAPTPQGERDIVDAAHQLDFYIQIRVIDVRAFLRWENILNNTLVAEVPGRPFPGQRVFYGVKWQFWN